MAAPAFAADQVIFRLNWTPAGEGEHALFYVALDHGYYAEQGLDVTIQPGTGSGDTLSRVGAGTADIGYADAGTILVARSGGAPLKMIGMVYQNTPATVWTRADTGIKTPKDLEGRTIGAPPGDAQRLMFPAFAQATGIDASKVTWVNISPAAKIQTLAAGRVDATVHFIDQKALYMDALGADNTIYMHWSDYGLNMYGMAIFVTEEMAKANPDVLRRFMAATLKGWEWTIRNPDEAVKIVEKYVPAANPTLLRAMLAEEIPLMDSPYVREVGLGYMNDEDMQRTIDLVTEYFEVRDPLRVDEVYTNEFLVPVRWPE